MAVKVGFAEQIRAATRKIEHEINEKCYEVGRYLFYSIIALTPNQAVPQPYWPQYPGYADGQMINNWFPVDGPSFSTQRTEDLDHRGGASKRRVRELRGKQFLGKDGTITLANNMHYAFRVEYAGWPKGGGPRGNWTGTRQPYAMVEHSIVLTSVRYKR